MTSSKTGWALVDKQGRFVGLDYGSGGNQYYYVPTDVEKVKIFKEEYRKSAEEVAGRLGLEIKWITISTQIVEA